MQMLGDVFIPPLMQVDAGIMHVARSGNGGLVLHSLSNDHLSFISMIFMDHDYL